MRRILASAFLASATAACAVSLNTQLVLADPVDAGWRLAYPGESGYGGEGMFQLASTDDSGLPIARAYQAPQAYLHSYYPMSSAQPAAQPPATASYQPPPVEQPQQRTSQPAAPVYSRQAPAPQRSPQPAQQVYYQQGFARPYQLPTPVYYPAPATPPAAQQQPAAPYYRPPAQIQRPSGWQAMPRQMAGYATQPQQQPAAAQPQQPRGLFSSLSGYQVAPQQYQPGFQQSPFRQVAFGYEPAPGYAPATTGDMTRPDADPRYNRQVVEYAGHESPGTIIIDTPHYFLYLVLDGGKALRYGIGVGRPGFTWAGVKEISSKREWPDWRPPAEMLARRPDLPHYMPGGPDNPLGARALYLGSSLYRIHGSNEPWTIGTQVSSGCIRLRNDDVVDLYGRVKVGTKVIVL
jgi:lipoprotein-anchoring transpeptidase ErfK/SrfK